MLDTEIISLRENGYSCRAVAEELAIEEHKVWSCMRRNGLAGKLRAAPERKPRMKIDIDYVLDAFGELAVERGLNGGYLVTIDGRTGEERMSIEAAIRDAMAYREGSSE